ncbi:MAG: hypothetical protein ACREX8_04905 [Gammaproteobacteria bacterium]
MIHAARTRPGVAAGFTNLVMSRRAGGLPTGSGLPDVQGRAVSRAPRWARSPLDYRMHLLLPEGDHPSGLLKARCGHLLLMVITQHDQPPPGLPCERCGRIFLADVAGRASQSQGGSR